MNEFNGNAIPQTYLFGGQRMKAQPMRKTLQTKTKQFFDGNNEKCPSLPFGGAQSKVGGCWEI